MPFENSCNNQILVCVQEGIEVSIFFSPVRVSPGRLEMAHQQQSPPQSTMSSLEALIQAAQYLEESESEFWCINLGCFNVWYVLNCWVFIVVFTL